MDLELSIVVGRVLAIVIALAALAWSLRRMRQESAEKLDALLAAQQLARVETQALAEKVAALATLVASIPARVERPAEAPRPAPRREPNQVRSYETARRLARSGATVEEIVATCGVAGTEARLLRRLHGGAAERDSAA
jgi:uncharacterized protein DUF2802